MDAPPGTRRGTTDVQVDLLLDPFGARWPDLRDAASTAAEAGFDGIWTYDHLDGNVYGAPDVLEGWTVLSALAAVVPGVALGPMVLNVANRHPGVLAPMVATLQDVAGGRLLLGLGAGARPGTPYAREQAAIGRPVFGDAERRLRVEHCVGELRRLWRTAGFLQPKPEPPVLIAAFGPKMAELAGRVGDGINARATLPRLPELLEAARRANVGAGRDPSRFLVTVFTEFDERWLAMDGRDRNDLVRLGVDRVVLSLGAPFDRGRITAAARLLDR